MGEALLQQLVSGDRLSGGGSSPDQSIIPARKIRVFRYRLGAGSEGPGTASARPQPNRLSDSGMAQNCPARRYVIDFGSNELDGLRHQLIVPQMMCMDELARSAGGFWLRIILTRASVSRPLRPH